MICCAPEHAAPDLMGFFEDSSGRHEQSHCYFKRQPQSAVELDQAVEAIRVSCCGALRYAGRIHEVLAKLRALGLEERCDYPERS